MKYLILETTTVQYDYWKSKQFFKLPIDLQKVLLPRNGSKYKEYRTNLKRSVEGKLC